MKKIKKIYLIRHGETYANAGQVFQSWDEDLTHNGLIQIEKVALHLKSSCPPPDRLITSSSKRTKQTADAFLKLTKPKRFEENDLFREIKSPPHIHGQPYSNTQAMKDYLKWYKHFSSGKKTTFADAEDLPSVIQRAKKALDYLKSMDDETIFVITHGFFLRAMVILIICGDDVLPKQFKTIFEHLKTANTGVTEIRFEKNFYKNYEWFLYKYNSSAHLDS